VVILEGLMLGFLVVYEGSSSTAAVRGRDKEKECRRF